MIEMMRMVCSLRSVYTTTTTCDLSIPNPAIFTIILTVIQGHKHGGAEYVSRIAEIEAMFAYILLPFLLIPLKLHACAS